MVTMEIASGPVETRLSRKCLGDVPSPSPPSRRTRGESRSLSVVSCFLFPPPSPPTSFSPFYPPAHGSCHFFFDFFFFFFFFTGYHRSQVLQGGDSRKLVRASRDPEEVPFSVARERF